MKKILNNNLSKSANGKQTNISKVLPPISPRPSKSVLVKSKFFKKNLTSSLTFKLNRYSYIQASKKNIKDIVKIKENFPKLLI